MSGKTLMLMTLLQLLVGTHKNKHSIILLCFKITSP